MQFSSGPPACVTVAWQTISLSRHWPLRGQVAPLGQLHFLSSRGGFTVSLKILPLCPLIMVARLLVHLQLTFTVFLFKIFLRGWSGPKCWSTNFRNFAPIFVFTAVEYGGLNHIVLRFLVLFGFGGFPFVGVKLSSKLYPLFCKASWYIYIYTSAQLEVNERQSGTATFRIY